MASNSNTVLFWVIFGFSIFLPGCSSTGQLDSKRVDVFPEPFLGCELKGSVEGKGSSLRARNARLNATDDAARNAKLIGANVIVLGFRTESRFLLADSVVRASAYSCPEAKTLCDRGSDAKYCHDYSALALKLGNREIARNYEEEGCKNGYAASCSYLDAYYALMKKKCVEGDIVTCKDLSQRATDILKRSDLAATYLGLACKAHDAVSCNQINFLFQSVECNEGKSLNCEKTAALAEQLGMPDESLEALRRGCALGSQKACVAFQALDAHRQGQADTVAKAEMSRLLAKQNTLIQEQTKQQAYDSMLTRIQMSFSRSAICNSTPLYGAGGRVTAISTNCY